MEIKTLIILVISIVSLYYIIFWLVILMDRQKEKIIMPKTPPLVSIIIPAYNEEKSIAQTIYSVLNLNYPKDKLQIIVANDGSTDNTQKIVEKIVKKYSSILLINQPNKGKAAAMNHALKYAKGEFFASLDSDSFVEKNALKNILKYFSDNEVASVTSNLKLKDPKTFIEKIQWFEYLINTFYKKLMSYLDCVFVTPGPFSIYRTKIVKELGGFDENHNLVEDFEMALKLQKAHYKIKLALDAEVCTIGPNTFRKLYKQRSRWYKGSLLNVISKKYRTLLFNKKYGDFAFIQLPVVIIAGIISLTLVSILLYDLFDALHRAIYNLNLVNFDLIFLIKNSVINANLLSLNFNRIALFLILILITILVVTYSHKYTNESIFRLGKFAGIVALVLYTFFYFMMLGLVWLGISFDLLIGKKQKW